MEQRNFFITVTLVLLALVSKWLVESAAPETSSVNREAHKIDYYVNNFTTTVMGAGGKPFRRLIAERMVHYPDDDTTELTSPFVTLFENKLPLWKIRSETGWLSGDGDLLLLQGKVTINRPKAPNISPVRIVTRNLRVQPKENYAETDEHITITNVDSRVESRGMQAWLTTPMRIKFTANVRGRYEVN